MPVTKQDRERDEDLVRLYLDEIGTHPLLTAEDEVRLAKQIEAGRSAASELLSAKRLTPTRRRQLRAEVAAGEEATERFVNANLRLVVSVAKKYQASGLPLLDLVQEGNLGLMHAVEKFDWRRGFKFSTYATWWIRQAIGRGIANTGRTIRLPVQVDERVRRLRRVAGELEGSLGRVPTVEELAEALEQPVDRVSDLVRHSDDLVSLNAPVGDDGATELADFVAQDGEAPFDVAAAALLPDTIERLLAPLDAEERQVLRLRYGLDRGEPRTQGEVGELLDLTPIRIHRLEKQGLLKLREAWAGTDAEDLLAS